MWRGWPSKQAEALCLFQQKRETNAVLKFIYKLYRTPTAPTWSTFSASPALAQDSWRNQLYPGGYIIQHGFDPNNPASISANKFIDNVDYLSYPSYVYEGMVIQAVTANSVETNAALFQLIVLKCTKNCLPKEAVSAISVVSCLDRSSWR